MIDFNVTGAFSTLNCAKYLNHDYLLNVFNELNYKNLDKLASIEIGFNMSLYVIVYKDSKDKNKTKAKLSKLYLF